MQRLDVTLIATKRGFRLDPRYMDLRPILVRFRGWRFPTDY
jgi:hypothetical protein